MSWSAAISKYLSASEKFCINVLRTCNSTCKAHDATHGNATRRGTLSGVSGTGNATERSVGRTRTAAAQIHRAYLRDVVEARVVHVPEVKRRIRVTLLRCLLQQLLRLPTTPMRCGTDCTSNQRTTHTIHHAGPRRHVLYAQLQEPLVRVLGQCTTRKDRAPSHFRANRTGRWTDCKMDNIQRLDMRRRSIRLRNTTSICTSAQ